tara:strand:- start:931 stop:1089 length:159 start_codon:yes stop_codon:yes gene_type:complete
MLFFIPVYFYSDALNLMQVLLPSSMLFALFFSLSRDNSRFYPAIALNSYAIT